MAPAQTLKLPKITRATLSNGVRLLVMEYRRAPVLAVRAVFRGGTAQDPAGKAGAADLMADLMTQGTANMSASQLQEEIDFLGASLSASPAPDYVSVNLDCLAGFSDKGLALLRDVVRSPSFPEQEFGRRKALSMTDLKTLADDPAGIADRVAIEAVFGPHPYGSLMTQTSLGTLTRDDVVDSYKRIVNPSNMIVMAVGDFKSPAMLTKLKGLFGDWPKGPSAAVKLPIVFNQKPRTVVVDKADATQAQIRFVRSGISVSSPDYYAMTVASSALGGGFSSRLVDEIRVDKSLTYEISSPFSDLMYGGSFMVTTFTKFETTKAIIDSTREVLSRTAKKGFTREELSRVKGYLVGAFAQQVQAPESLASRLAVAELYKLPQDYLEKYLSRIQAVTITQVNKIARTYFAPTSLSLVIVAPYAKVKAQIDGLGRVTMRPLDSVGK